MEPETIVQELIQANVQIACKVQLRGRIREFRFWGTARGREGRKVSILITHRPRKGDKVRKFNLAGGSCRITPFRIHIRKA